MQARCRPLSHRGHCVAGLCWKKAHRLGRRATRRLQNFLKPLLRKIQRAHGKIAVVRPVTRGISDVSMDAWVKDGIGGENADFRAIFCGSTQAAGGVVNPDQMLPDAPNHGLHAEL